MFYEIKFKTEALIELEEVTAYQRAIIIDAIEKNLHYEPTTPSRNRKIMGRTGRALEIGATWELRVDKFRVYYDVGPGAVVVIRVVEKGRNTTDRSLS
jgi:mRNA-degrading endonuclease RelE of RelBE toxin-antitoxin system